MPPAEKLAVVAAALALPNVAVPGPLTWLQVIVRDGPSASATEPASEALAGRVTDRSAPALTTGASFTGVMVMLTVAVALPPLPSLTV